MWNDVEGAKARLTAWGLTSTVRVTRGTTLLEIVGGFRERTGWLRWKMPEDNGPDGPWHLIEMNEHAVYGFRDPDVAFEFRMKFS